MYIQFYDDHVCNNCQWLLSNDYFTMHVCLYRKYLNSVQSSRNTSTLKVQFTPGVVPLHCLHLMRCLRTLCVFNQSDKDSKKDSSIL